MRHLSLLLNPRLQLLLQAHSWVDLGKLCLLDEKLAKELGTSCRADPFG